MPLPDVRVTGRVEAVSLRVTGQGSSVCNFTVVAHKLRRRGDEWKETDHTRIRAVCWDTLAERVGDAVIEGTDVTVIGELKQLARDQGYELTAKSVSLALPLKAQRERPQESPDDPWDTKPPDDPWAGSPATDPANMPPF